MKNNGEWVAGRAKERRAVNRWGGNRREGKRERRRGKRERELERGRKRKREREKVWKVEAEYHIRSPLSKAGCRHIQAMFAMADTYIESNLRIRNAGFCRAFYTHPW